MEPVFDVYDRLNEVNMNGIASGTETDSSLASETCLLSSEANALVSVPEDISSSGDKLNGCVAVIDVGQSSRELDDVVSAAELKTLLLNAEAVVFTDHSIVPFSPSCETGDLSGISAATTLPAATVDANDILGASISVPESSHKTQPTEVNTDSSVQQFSSSYQEANSLSFYNTDMDISEVECNVKHTISPAELCELRPEEIRWLYRDSGSHQKKWLPFIGYDSLRIECKFRETRARLAGNSSSCGNAADELVIVRGGLYEVDVIQKMCAPIYWTAEGVTGILTFGSKT